MNTHDQQWPGQSDYSKSLGLKEPKTQTSQRDTPSLKKGDRVVVRNQSISGESVVEGTATMMDARQRHELYKQINVVCALSGDVAHQCDHYGIRATKWWRAVRKLQKDAVCFTSPVSNAVKTSTQN